MALPIVRAAALFYNSRLVAECYSGDQAVDPRRQALFGAQGYLTHSRGAVTGSIQIEYIVPVGGTTPDMLADTLAQNDVETAVPIDGVLVTATAAITQNTMKWNTETGRCEGTLRLEYGPPTVV